MASIAAGIFTEDDDLILSKTLRGRERLMDVIMSKPDDQLPTKPSELLALANLMESIDRTVISRAKIRVDAGRNDDDSERKLILQELMFRLHNERQNAPALPNGNVVDVEAKQPSAQQPVYTPKSSTVSPGELILKVDTGGIPEEYQT